MVKLAAYQIAPVGESEGRKEQLRGALAKAEREKIDFLCLPEGFLTGYYAEERLARESALEVDGRQFDLWLNLFNHFSGTVVVGFNEQKQGKIFDSAAVIERGQLLGIQRKHYLYHPYFSRGEHFSVFQSKGILFGVAICLDTNYFEPSRLLAMQGAAILFSPMCNRVALSHRYAQRPLYYSHLVARSFENRCWVVTADWIWPNDGKDICPGHSVIYDPEGMEMARSQEMNEELLQIEIPTDRLFFEKGLRVKGSGLL